MKKFLATIILSLPLLCFAQPGAPGSTSALIDGYRNEFMHDGHFTFVTVTQKMFDILAKVDVNDPDDQQVMDILKNLTGINIMVCTDSSKKSKCKEIYDELKWSIPNKDFETLMSVEDKDEDVNILVKEDGDVIKELIILTGSQDETDLISLTGVIDLKDIAKLSKSMDIQGMDKLELLDDQTKGPKEKK